MKYLLHYSHSRAKKIPISLASTAIMLTVVVFLSTGCSSMPSHIHNNANAKLAGQAQDEMAEYAKGAPAMYTAMLSNVDKFKVEEEYLLTELATNFNSSLITKLPTMTWEALYKRIENCKYNITKFKGRITADAKKRKMLEGSVEDAKTAVKKAQEAVQTAKEDVTAWNAYVALIQQGFGNISTDISKINKDNGIDALIQAANEAGKKEITFSDADGNEVKKTAKEILKDRLPSGKDWEKFKALPDAPGITLLIMNMGVELAQIEQRRAEVRLSQLNKLTELYENAYVSMELADQMIKDIENVDKPPVLGNKIISAIGDEWKLARTAMDKAKPDWGTWMLNENAIANQLVMLRKEALVESIITRNESLFAVAIARLEHEQSINESATGDKTWQALIKSGLAGLYAYHQGGFTKEDAANIIRIAQTIALAFIADRTN